MIKRQQGMVVWRRSIGLQRVIPDRDWGEYLVAGLAQFVVWGLDRSRAWPRSDPPRSNSGRCSALEVAADQFDRLRRRRRAGTCAPEIYERHRGGSPPIVQRQQGRFLL